MKDDAIVAKRGVEAYRAFYAKTYHDERRSWYKSPKSVVYALTYNLTNLAWELAGLFRFTDYRHRRLLEFIINLKTLPWQGLNTDDPPLLFDSAAVAAVAHDYWNSDPVGNHTMAGSNRHKECERWIGTSLFIARLFDAGLLEIQGLHFMISDIQMGLEEQNKNSPGLVRTCQEVVAVQYILIAGHVIAKEAKAPTISRTWKIPLNAEKWKTWAAILEELAQTTSDDGEWGLRADAAKAHQKMMDLWPGLFERSFKRSEYHTAARKQLMPRM